MPNHVKNVVKMEGITNLPLFVEEDGKRRFDFNKIILMPESLNIESGSMTDECAMYYLTEKCTIPVGCLDAEKMKTAKGIIGNLFSKQEESGSGNARSSCGGGQTVNERLARRSNCLAA